MLFIQSKRNLKIASLFALGLGFLAILFAGWAIRSAAKGRAYSDVSLIPHRKVGVILGCSQRLSDGRANLFFRDRITAVAAEMT